MLWNKSLYLRQLQVDAVHLQIMDDENDWMKYEHLKVGRWDNGSKFEQSID